LGVDHWFVFLSSHSYSLSFGHFTALWHLYERSAYAGSGRGREKIISQFCILLVVPEKGWVETDDHNEDWGLSVTFKDHYSSLIMKTQQWTASLLLFIH
jgi:hypothetical protein